MEKLVSKGTQETAGGRGKKNHELQPIGGQRASLPQQSEQSNIRSKQLTPESCETDHVEEHTSYSGRRNDKDDPGQMTKR